jgi:hypothetical protein
MKNEIIPYDLINKLLPGVANRQHVIDRLGKPEVVSLGQDYRVIYKYPTEGIEVVIRLGRKTTLSIVKALLIVYPFKESCKKILNVGMPFSQAKMICDTHYELEIDTGNSRIYSLGDPKLNLQIWKKKGLLEKIEFFQ